MKIKEPPIVVGRIASPYGIQGWVKIISHTEPRTNILDYKPWLIETQKGWQTVELKEGRAHGQGLIALINGITNPEQARTYVHAKIAITAEQLRPLPIGEYYWKDLIGLQVVNQQNVSLGRVIELFETGANDVLIVKGDNHEYFIPYLLDTIVLNIDLSKKLMQVNWDEDF